jgi:RHS repeat-associated protein
LAQYTSGGGTSILDHIVYNPFGQIIYQSTPADQPRFTYAGQRLDSATGLSYEGRGSSWYDAVNGVFASQGAPGYNGSVANPFEYMGNKPNGRFG